MSDVQIISGVKEKQLLSSMESAIKKANSGMDPNEAIAKTANEQGLSPEFACRMVEAFNTSKTIKHLKDNEGEKRADTFGIADKEKVLKLMYTPTEEKTAEQLISDPFKFDFNKTAEDFKPLETIAKGVEDTAQGAVNALLRSKTKPQRFMSKVVGEAEGSAHDTVKALSEGRAHDTVKALLGVKKKKKKTEKKAVLLEAAVQDLPGALYSGAKNIHTRLKKRGAKHRQGRARPLPQTTVKQATSKLDEIKWACRG
jgi:hypothetical protein